MAVLRRRGLPTAVICSEPFLELGKTQARVFGVPALPIVVIPHPLGGLSIDDVRARATTVLPAFIKLVCENVK